MKFILEATGKVGKSEDYEDIEIPVELDLDGEYENTNIVFSTPDWWIPIKEIERLIEIAKILNKGV